ncbi:MAG: hypothetical protein Q7U73_12745 [Rubrivivax sp.]|nr:hypothetical protein [Rubrivivax sp.]
MLDSLVDYFLSEPRRMSLVGAFLARFASFLVVAGLVGQLAVTATESIKRLVPQAQAAVRLADVLPSYPSWWIPESALGFGGALLLLVAGLALARTGRVYERQFGA